MKASQLNVTDWFSIDGEAQQVQPVLIDYVWNDFMPPLNIEPIQLDRDILMANDFEHIPVFSVKDRYRLFLSGRGCWVTAERLDGENFYLVSTDTNQGKFDDIKVEYVHELQHLLRVAGLDDLAEEFKLMKGNQP